MKPEGAQQLTVVPSTKHEVNAYVKQLHRHNKTVAGGRVFLAVLDQTGKIRGVAVAGRACRTYDDRFTVEITRVATDGCPNACSALYARMRRVLQAYGFTKIITYNLPAESGASLRAIGLEAPEAENIGGGSWERKGRPRPNEKHNLGKKNRWRVA